MTNRLAQKISQRAREGVSRDALAQQQLMYRLRDMGSLGKVTCLFSPAAYVRFLLKRAPLRLRPSLPIVAGGVAVQSSTVPRPSGFERHFDIGDPALATAFSRLELVLRGGHSSELVDF